MQKALSKNRYYILAIIITLLISYYIYSSTNRIPEEFISMGILGENRQADKYFRTDNNELDNDTKLNWTIFLENKMNKRVYVQIYVKIITTHEQMPSDEICNPSPVKSITEFNFTLDLNEKRYEPFVWQIENTSKVSNSSEIQSIIFNDEVYGVLIEGRPDNIFGILFELWIYDAEINDYEFSWHSQRKERCVWNLIWFELM